MTISLCRAGQYLSHPVFSILCHVFNQLVFLHVSLHVVPPSLFRSTSAPSPKTSSPSEFEQMWLRSRLKQCPNHFSLLFSRKGSTGFTCASFLMASFPMWSNLVFPLAHLILINQHLIITSYKSLDCIILAQSEQCCMNLKLHLLSQSVLLKTHLASTRRYVCEKRFSVSVPILSCRYSSLNGPPTFSAVCDTIQEALLEVLMILAPFKPDVSAHACYTWVEQRHKKQPVRDGVKTKIRDFVEHYKCQFAYLSQLINML